MSESEEVSRELFGQQLMQAFEEITGGEFRFDLDEFSIHRIDGEGVFNLANVYAEHCQLAAEDRFEHILHLASSLAGEHDELPGNYSDAKPNLRPKIWARDMIEFQNLKQRLEGKAEMDMPFQLIGEHLMLTLVYDTPHAMRSLSRENYEAWGVTFEQAVEDATANLLQDTLAWSKIGDGVLCSMTGDNYDSSRILLLSSIRKHQFKGPPVALIPDRDSLLIADSADAESVALIFKLVEENGAALNRPLSPLPLIYKDDVWGDWEPPANHAIRKSFDAQRQQFVGGMYTEQQQLINSIACEQSEFPFVATFSVLEGSDSGERVSYCVWSEGVVSYLPKTDVVLFYDGEELQNICRWENVVDAFGELLVADESFYPVRYLTMGFPAKERLDEVPSVE